MTEPAQSELEQQLRPLWLRAQAGDEAAYRLALGLCARRLRVYFGRRLAAQPHDVEDLVQETLLALHLQRGTYDDSVPVTAWLHAIARHKLIDQLRRLGRNRRLFESIDELPDELHPVQDVESTAGRDLDVLLASLPATQREVILDTKIEGLSVSESALRRSVSESAVKVYVHRGLKKLARIMRDRT
jgi:RNA polymerase sigma-70 factor (ECF subfamily)